MQDAGYKHRTNHINNAVETLIFLLSLYIYRKKVEHLFIFNGLQQKPVHIPTLMPRFIAPPLRQGCMSNRVPGDNIATGSSGPSSRHPFNPPPSSQTLPFKRAGHTIFRCKLL
jgi:hypothetical protein